MKNRLGTLRRQMTSGKVKPHRIFLRHDQKMCENLPVKRDRANDESCGDFLDSQQSFGSLLDTQQSLLASQRFGSPEGSVVTPTKKVRHELPLNGCSPSLPFTQPSPPPSVGGTNTTVKEAVAQLTAVIEQMNGRAHLRRREIEYLVKSLTVTRDSLTI